MFANLITVDLLLHIAYEMTLFLLLSIVLYKLFMQYGIPAIYGYIQEVKEHKKDLENRCNLTKSLISKTEKEAIEQEKHLLNIEEKIKIWHQALLQEQENEKLKNKILAENIHKKAIVQRKQLHMDKVQQEVMPKAIELAHKEFEEYSTQGEKDFRTLIDRLAENISSLEGKRVDNE